jgi:predicted component of type VI protein secretion system
MAHALPTPSRLSALDPTLLDLDLMAPAFLYVEEGPGSGQLLPIGQRAITLGRGPECDLQLSHPSVSRAHAKLLRHGNRFFLWDVETPHGTFVNQMRIAEKVPTEIHLGDVLLLGPSRLRLRSGSRASQDVRLHSHPKVRLGAVGSIWRSAILMGALVACAQATLQAL